MGRAAVKIFSIRQHRVLLFRSYLIIVGGLIVIASVLDFSLDRLQDSDSPTSSQWIDGNLVLIEAQLQNMPAADWPEAIDDLALMLGFPVRVFPSDQVVQTNDRGNATQEVFDAQDRPAYIRSSALLNSVIQIGPMAEATTSENPLIILVSPLFYLSVFLFVGL
jgi:hypothetical protein